MKGLASIKTMLEKRGREFSEINAAIRLVPKPKGRFWMPNTFIREYLWAIGKTYGAPAASGTARVMMVLSSHAGMKGYCWPSLKRICEESYILNRNQVEKYLRLLEDVGMLKVNRQKGRIPNTYLLVDSRHWRPVNSIISEDNDIKTTPGTVSPMISEGLSVRSKEEGLESNKESEGQTVS